MRQSAANEIQGIPVPERDSSEVRQLLEERLLAKVLSESGAGFSGLDKARALVAAYGDLGKILRTEPHRLKGVADLSDDDLSSLHVLRRAGESLATKGSLSQPIIGSLSALEAYLRSSTKREASVILMDQRNLLQADIELGTAARYAASTVREIVRISLEHGASAAIVVQRLRSDDITVDQALINHAAIIARNLERVGIILQDYVIWSDRRNISMRASGVSACPIGSAQNACHPVF